jgi:hypothetical protein
LTIARGVGTVGSRASPHARSAPPVGHDGTERHSPRPTDAPAQNTWYSGKKKRQRLKHLLRLNATLRLVFLSGTALDRVHDKRPADTTSYPLPARSPLLQDLGFQGFTLEGVAILQPTKQPCGRGLMPE